MRRRLFLILGAGIAAVATGATGLWVGIGTASATSRPAPSVLTCGGSTVTKPKVYVLTCADANAQLSAMRWTTWSTERAVGYGTIVYNSCKPACAAGSPVRVRA